jgi:hypothetical protein
VTVLAALVLAAAAAATPPLGVWPSTSGPAASTVDDVEFYVTEPDADYWILAAQPLPKPLANADDAELKRLAALANKLGADAVVLLGELPEKDIPKEMDEALPATGRIGMAVFVTFDCGCDEDGGEGSRHARVPPARQRAGHPRQGTDSGAQGTATAASPPFAPRS